MYGGLCVQDPVKQMPRLYTRASVENDEAFSQVFLKRMVLTSVGSFRTGAVAEASFLFKKKMVTVFVTLV